MFEYIWIFDRRNKKERFITAQVPNLYKDGCKIL